MPDDRSSVMFYSKQACPNILIKFHNLTSDNMKEAQQLIQKLNPDNEIYLISYKSTMQTMYQPQYNFREAVLIGGVVTLIIALLGLVGYTNDEVVRRQKEIAIRKVNGAEVKDILHLFIKDILRIAVPSLIVSGVGALIVARKWLEQFSDKAHLSFFLFLGSGLLVLGIIIVAVAINCHKVANGNPVEYIKGE
jgi:putative ABC transport system permease protein